MVVNRWASSTLLVGIAILLGGCVSPGHMPEEWPEDPIERSRRSASAPAEIQNPELLVSCGAFWLDHDTELPATAFDCMNEAFDSGAELAFVRPTTEGDPVVIFYRVGPGVEGLDIFEDATLDSYGGRWWISHCPDTLDVRNPKGCEYEQP